MVTTVLGKVAVTPKGEWNGTTAYEKLDVVSYGGSSYLSVRDVPAGTSLSNTNYWMLLAQKGDTGNGIESIELTSTSGNVKTYTITFTDGDTFEFDVVDSEVTDEEFSEAIANGKNLFHNGKPQTNVTSWDGTTANIVDGWTRVMSSSRGDNIQFDSLAGEYLHAKFDAKVYASKPGLVQFEKIYKQGGSVFNDGILGGEIKDILGGQNVTLSLEVKANQPVYVHKQLMVQFNDGTPNLTVLDPGTSEADPPVVLPEDGWKKLTVSATMPDDWKTILAGSNVTTAMLMINIYLRDAVSAVISGVEYWVRNVKMEYGTVATDFTYSDYDETQLLSNVNTLSFGNETDASGYCAMAIGRKSTATGKFSFAGGNYNPSLGVTEATGEIAFAFGLAPKASGQNAFSLGQATVASATLAFATGDRTVASGQRSFTGGDQTIANHRAQVAFGQFNVADTSEADASARGTYVEIVGNGTANNARSNARTLDWDGNESLAGGLTLGKGTADEVTLTPAQLKALLALLN